MTKEDLKEFGITDLVSQKAFQAAVLFLSESVPSNHDKRGRDSHQIALDSGFTEGWRACLKELKEIHLAPAPPTERKAPVLYSEPKKP